ncbi:MAG: MFS transporter [Chloroflexi bacterium]|nr:MFS transporter [Chloroflexota bacterium]
MNTTKTAQRLTLVAMILASGIVFLDSTVVNVALPHIDRDLNMGLSGLQWIVDGYILTLAAFLIPGGSIGDQYGRKKAMMGGILFFGITSVACGLAPGSTWLILARLLQGVGGAFMVPGSLAILTATFTDPEERGKAIGTWAGWSGITSLIGPFLGGWLVDNLSWRLVFLINVPVIAGVLILMRFVPESLDEGVTKHLDWAGTLLGVIGLGGVVYGLIEGPVAGWTDWLVLVSLVAGIIALVLFIGVELREPHPMMPLGLFKSRNFSAVNVVTLLVYFALYGGGFFYPLYIQNIMRQSALLSGVVFLPSSILMLLLSPRMGKLAGQYGARLFMTIGPLIYAVGTLGYLLVQPDSNPWLIILPIAFITGFGLSLTVAPLTGTVMSSVPGHNSGVASAINNVVSRIAALLAIAGLGIFVSQVFMNSLADLSRSLPPDKAQQLQSVAMASNGSGNSQGLPPDLAAVNATAYTTAFHWVIVITASLAFLGALVSLVFIQNQPRSQGQKSSASLNQETVNVDSRRRTV